MPHGSANPTASVRAGLGGGSRRIAACSALAEWLAPAPPVVPAEIGIGPTVNENDTAAEEVGRVREHEAYPLGELARIAEASCGNGECPYGPCQIRRRQSCSCKSGVSTAPGASTLSRMPAPAHSGRTAWFRAHRVTAIFDAA